MTAAVARRIEVAGYRPYAYSGRFMYGARCLGVNVESAADLVRLGTEAGPLPEAAIDEMGKGLVAYWPELPWPDDEQE